MTIRTIRRLAATALITSLALLQSGCIIHTAWDSGKVPPPPTGDYWLTLADLNGTWHRNKAGSFDAAGYHGAPQLPGLDCPYTLTPLPKVKKTWLIYPPMPWSNHVTVACNDGKSRTFKFGSQYYAKPDPSALEFAQTWQVMAALPARAETDQRFTSAAADYRAAAEPPALPEETRVWKVGAETAVREKRWRDAVIQYRQGLDRAPAWPQARFNIALMYGELKLFAAAVDEMQKYLLLVPDAANARQAQDKIYEWQAQISRAQP